MPYRDPEKQRAAMRVIIRQHRERQKAKEQAKDARLKEFEERERQRTEEITESFKPKMSTIPDDRDERISELEQMLTEKDGTIADLGLQVLFLRAKAVPEPVMLVCEVPKVKN